jgi:hypothetical protein
MKKKLLGIGFKLAKSLKDWILHPTEHFELSLDSTQKVITYRGKSSLLMQTLYMDDLIVRVCKMGCTGQGACLRELKSLTWIMQIWTHSLESWVGILMEFAWFRS